jgi:hypothetical protein
MEWRKGPKNSLYARRIQRSEYPQLIAAMMEHGTMCLITDKGLVWYYGPYVIQSIVVRKVWGISHAQMQRLKTHILEQDPWGGTEYAGHRYLDE